jgi:hypothetical protein
LPEPPPPSPPDGLSHIVGYFLELNDGRRSGGFGPEIIGHEQILAWSHLTGVVPSPLEIRLIMILDRTYLMESRRLHDLQTAAKAPAPKPGRR